MNHRFWVLGMAFFGFIGCAHQQTRLQAPDETERDKEAEVKTIGDLTIVSNADPIPISGVGLVVGLEGTGGSAPPGNYRTFLEDQLRKENVDHVKDLLASPNVAMVLVSALIPPGAHKDDPLDVEISLPPQSKVTSLRGGHLRECALYNYDTTKHLSPNFEGSNRLLKGHVYGMAKGPLLVGMGDGKDDAPGHRQGRIWGGARCMIDRPFFLIMNKEQQRVPVVQQVTSRINETFHGNFGGPGGELATAKTNVYLTLRVPVQYKLNLPRFLRVVRLIPLRAVPPGKSPYRKRLQEDLLDPAHTVTAALRLEALGSDSIPILKEGLHSAHAKVRFTSAEALAYLGSPTAGEELARLVEQQPLLRAYCLTAMASLDEAVCHVKLRELLNAHEAETRYGAFRALRALDEHESAIGGELLNDSFWLHRVGSQSSGLVHLSTNRRAEVVLFGDAPNFIPPFSFLAGEFTVTAAADDTHCTISRLSARHGMSRRQCSLAVEDVLHILASMDGRYPEVIELLQQAGKFKCVSCPVAVDALPQAVSVYDLAGGGAKDANVMETEVKITPEELGATPTLYEKNTRKAARPSVLTREDREQTGDTATRSNDASDVSKRGTD
jgi:hypothetical protein